MNYTNLCNLILEELLLESLQSGISKLNSELEIIKTKFRGDKPEFKKQLKQFKKKFIAKIVKENYNSLLTTFFPQLVRHKDTTDDAFYNLLFKHPDVWTDMTSDDFKDFVHRVEQSIDYWSERNNSQFDNLRFLSQKYIKY